MADEDIRDDHNPDVTGRDRLEILRKILYIGGSFYLLVIVALVIIRPFYRAGDAPASAELTTLITF